jgi:FeS assembly SUF system regulator
MLKISKLTDYATVIMSFLALYPEKIFSAAHIAQEIHLGAPTVSKILKILLEADLVKSFRGTEGGYQLARSAKEISIADVVSAIEGKFAMTECSMGKNICAIDKHCGIKENWQIINKVIFKALSDLTLADMNRHP